MTQVEEFALMVMTPMEASLRLDLRRPLIVRV